MYGFWYSVKENYSFTRQELKELFWTSLAFAFVISSYYKDLFVFSGGDVRIVLSSGFLAFFILAVLCILLAMYIHVGLQKIVGIRLGYNVTYSYWLNGILLGLFLAVLTFGKIPVLSVFILPGAVKLEQISKLRLGRFRYGLNAKDIARVSLAGPLSHIFFITILGIIFFVTGESKAIMYLIHANLLLLIYSILPIPKIDYPTRMDSASDGLGIFFYNRMVYVLCAITVLFYVILVWAASTFSFTVALILGLISTWIYLVAMKQPT
ncbi:MAG: hypothetical protein ACP5OA_04980 [Candidatus Woesearchaeota archaeon]